MDKVGPIIDLIETGIKSEGLRQKSIASNVANLQTPGYRTLDVNFKEVLADALASGTPLDWDDLASYLYQPKTTQVQSNGNDVNLEVEVGKMIKNTLRHKTYIRLLQTKYEQMELAITMR
jgi:flagellar basal-body rod protein FlgB